MFDGAEKTSAPSIDGSLQGDTQGFFLTYSSISKSALRTTVSLAR
jgi:hypothetical protein